MAKYHILEVALIWSNEDTTFGTVSETGVILECVVCGDFPNPSSFSRNQIG